MSKLAHSNDATMKIIELNNSDDPSMTPEFKAGYTEYLWREAVREKMEDDRKTATRGLEK